jgi:hypothetical protein
MRGGGVRNVVILKTCFKYANLVIYEFKHVIDVVCSHFLLIV